MADHQARTSIRLATRRWCHNQHSGQHSGTAGRVRDGGMRRVSLVAPAPAAADDEPGPDRSFAHHFREGQRQAFLDGLFLAALEAAAIAPHVRQLSPKTLQQPGSQQADKTAETPFCGSFCRSDVPKSCCLFSLRPCRNEPIARRSFGGHAGHEPSLSVAVISIGSGGRLLLRLRSCCRRFSS